MACYHPLKAFPIGLTDRNKTKYKICSYNIEFVYSDVNGRWYACESENKHKHEYAALANKVVKDFIEIPCGQCIGCRFDRSRQWANRCMLELGYHKSSYFVTLTYNDESVPGGVFYDKETGLVLRETLSLKKRDFQLFIKRLRKDLDGKEKPKIRYFACGEYGSRTQRPHYHAILFGLELPEGDLQVWSRSELGYTTYRSPYLEGIWGFGNVIVGEVNWETCAYTARYITKKLNGDAAEFYKKNCVEPPFSLMSRRKGIARQYYEDHPDLYDFDTINVQTEKKGLSFRIPKYFDYLESLSDPVGMAERKEKRIEFMEDLKRSQLERTDLSYLELLAVKEQNFKNRTKILMEKGRSKADA